jgi:hypothetical protein
MNIPVSTRTPAQVWAAFAMGSVALLRAWLVIYPTGITVFTATPALIAFEVVKTAILLIILVRTYVLINKENDQVARLKHFQVFTMAASVSVLIDIAITLSKL